MENNRFFKEYALSDLFDNTFKMLKSTWKNSLIISLICFVPMSLLTVVIMSKYFQVIVDIMKMAMDYQENLISDPYIMLRLFLPMFGYIAALVFVSVIGTIIVKSVITLNTFSIIKGEQPTLKELVVTIMNTKLARLLLQPLLMGAVSIGISIGGSIAVGITVMIFSFMSPILGGLVAVLGIIALICACVWIFISLNFIQEEVLYADTQVVESFKKSFALVRGNWWRVFGFMILIGLTVSFAVSIFTGPLIYPMMMPMYSDMMKQILNGNTDMSDIYTSMFSAYSKAQIPLFFSSLASSVLTYMVLPVFSAFFFIDLNVRKKEPGFESGDVSDQPPGEETDVTGTVPPAGEDKTDGE